MMGAVLVRTRVCSSHKYTLHMDLLLIVKSVYHLSLYTCIYKLITNRAEAFIHTIVWFYGRVWWERQRKRIAWTWAWALTQSNCISRAWTSTLETTAKSAEVHKARGDMNFFVDNAQISNDCLNLLQAEIVLFGRRGQYCGGRRL